MVNIDDYDIEISRHAFIRAIQRWISPDTIETTLQCGRQHKFGRNFINFIRGKIICIGQITKNKIKIITIEKK